MSAEGNIYDLGYQGYDGPRLGRSSVTLGLLRHTLASAYGIGRGGRAKVIPFGLGAMAVLPAVLAVGITALVSQSGAGEALGEASPIRHDTYHGITVTLVMLFCAAQAPELFGKDQRYNVLPLYFSRVLTRTDYAAARLGGLILAVFLVTVVPHLVLTLGEMLASDPVTGLSDEAADIPRYLAVSALTSGLLAAIAAVIAAWVPRRAYATAAIIAVFLIPGIVVAVVQELAVSDLAQLLVFVSPGDIATGVNAAIFGVLADSPAVAAADYPDWVYVVASAIGIAGSGALVVRRYLGPIG